MLSQFNKGFLAGIIFVMVIRLIRLFLNHIIGELN